MDLHRPLPPLQRRDSRRRVPGRPLSCRAILALAASAPTVGARIILLVAYAAGLSVPRLVVFVAMRRFRSGTRGVAGHRRLVDVVTGTLVAGVGILVFSGAFARLAGLFTFGVV